MAVLENFKAITFVTFKSMKTNTSNQWAKNSFMFNSKHADKRKIKEKSMRKSSSESPEL